MNTSIILVAYYADSWLPACLDSLARASSQRLHLVLVDNAGNTIIDQLDLSGFDIEILQTPRPMGFAEANNFALMHAQRLEETVSFLNQDTISGPDWIDRCQDCFAHDARLGAVSPLIRTYDGSSWDPSFHVCLPAGESLQLTAEDKTGNEWFYTKNVPAASLIVRTEVLQKTGPFDPVYGSYYEDFDLCRRIRVQGYEVGVCKTATIRHLSGSATIDRTLERKRMRQIIRNRVVFQLRDSNKPRLPQALRYALIDFPRRLTRGLFKTPSSQPPLVVLQAYGDLLSIAGRLLSRKNDEAAWQDYLNELDWSSRISDLAVRK